MIRYLIIYLFPFLAIGQAGMFADFQEQVSYEQANSSTEIYTTANALATDAYEANSATTGITTFLNPSNIAISVEPTTVYSGSYALKFENVSGLTNTGISQSLTSFPVEIGETYDVTCRVYRVTGSDNWGLKLPDDGGWVTSISYIKPPTGVWTSVTLTGITDDITADFEINANSGNDDGDIILIDILSVTKQ